MIEKIRRISAVVFMVLSFSTIISCNAEEQEASVITIDGEYTEGSWYVFRKTFDLKGNTETAKLKIETDTKYWLWINGQLELFEGGLFRGPAPKDGYYDIIENPGGLVKAENTIAVLVYFSGRESTGHITSPTAGLYFDLTTNKDHIVSDDTWKASLHPAFYIPEGEKPNLRISVSNVGFDARKAIDFYSVDFDDSSWHNAITMSVEDAGWGEMVERPIPQWKDYGLKEYESVVLEEDGTLVARLPYDAQVTPYLKVKGAAGKVIDIRADTYGSRKIVSKSPDTPAFLDMPAMPDFAAIFKDAAGNPMSDQEIADIMSGGNLKTVRVFKSGLAGVRAEYITKDGEQEYESLGWMNGHYIFYTVPKDVEVIEVRYRETGYNTEFTGSFKCDDEFYNILWEKARRTLYINMREYYFDCPHRERSQWIGDATNEIAQTFYAFDTNSHKITEKAIREVLNFQREDDGRVINPSPGEDVWGEFPMQAMAFLSYGIAYYYENTGDKEPVIDLFDKIKRYVHLWQLDDNGLVVPRNQVDQGFSDWGDWGSNIDKNLMFSLWNVILLDHYVQYAGWVSDSAESAWASDRSEKLKRTINEKLWNGDFYASNGYSEDPDDRAQALAVVSGVLPPDKYGIIRPFFKEHFNASPYMEYYVLEALCKMGFYQDAMERMKIRYDEMVFADYSTLWESWGVGNGKSHSYNHGWSGAPLVMLSKYICGISPIEPGYKTFEIKPNLTNLEWVESNVTTQYGDIKASIRKTADGMHLVITIPKSTSAKVTLPEKYEKININGEDMTQTDLEELTGGEYTIVAHL